MTSFAYTVNDALGIHARPAGLLVKEAMKFSCAVKMETPTKTVDAKRIMAVMGAGVKCGDTVTLAFDGADEKEAAAAIEAFFKANL